MSGTAAKVILVVEDSKMIRFQLCKFLAGQGYETRQAGSGSEALAQAAGCDLVLMDIRMPEMDGLEATKRLKADPLTAGIPIILLTGVNEEGAREQGLAAGAASYVTKPANLLQLVAVIRQYTEAGG